MILTLLYRDLVGGFTLDYIFIFDKLYFEHCSCDVTRAVSQKAMVKIFKIDLFLFFLNIL